MKKEKCVEEIRESIEYCDIKRLTNAVKELLALVSEDEAAIELINLLNGNYTTFKAEATAEMMAAVIKVQPSIGTIQFPQNYFFRLAVVRGSMELYNTYQEVVVQPYIAEKGSDEGITVYSDLFAYADDLTTSFFPKYVRCIKGMDFNGAFGSHEENEHVVLINREDYELMDDVVEKYNCIVGRRDILTDLEKRIDAA